MPWRPSDSEPAYDLLHPLVRRWVYHRGWPTLRDIQKQAVPVVTDADRDLIISAVTASGKTEAAFLPICSAILHGNRRGDGVQALYVSPLKALINDQWERLDDLCESLDIPVHRWHGDVSGSAKSKVFSAPDGILLITPESLEALFVRRGPELSRVLNGLRWVVIDELHSFIGTERGAQLRSLLHRLELVLRRQVTRIGLSATLGDMDTAREFLRTRDRDSVLLIKSDSDPAVANLRIHGYVHTPPAKEDNTPRHPRTDPTEATTITEHLFRTMRDGNHLIFVNGRRDAELHADRLRTVCEKRRIPNQFFPHHGNLSKEVREDVEDRLKGHRPTTAICTSTLELGVDLGEVSSVAQIGPPPTVAGLRQRLGRSGRRDSRATLRMYVTEDGITGNTPLVDQLRIGITQAVAMVDLLSERWYEPPELTSPHLSTLTQQILSVIAQHQGATAAQLFRALCDRGPFHRVDSSLFQSLLRDLSAAGLIEQDEDGQLALGARGESIVNHFSFYAVFATPREFRLIHGATTLGTIPVIHAVSVGQTLIFAGRPWKVMTVDERAHQIEVTPTRRGMAPRFSGVTASVHDTVRQRMRRWYESDDQPRYLDSTAGRLLDDGRRCYRRLGLDREYLVSSGADVVMFPWLGDRALDTLAVWLRAAGLRAERDAIAVTIAGQTPDGVRQVVRDILAGPRPAPGQLAARVTNTTVDKFDEHLGKDLRAHSYGHAHLDIPGAADFLRILVASSSPRTANEP